MITVDNKFYESGCTMEGKENRIMLSKDGKTHIEMVFLGEMVEIKGVKEEGKKYSRKKYFDDILLITANRNAEPLILAM